MRTDLFFVCPSCLVRTVATCPQCRATKLLDLRRLPHRHRAQRLLERDATHRRTARIARTERILSWFADWGFAQGLPLILLHWVYVLIAVSVIWTVFLGVLSSPGRPTGGWMLIPPIVLTTALYPFSWLWRRKLISDTQADVDTALAVIADAYVPAPLPAGPSLGDENTWRGTVRATHPLASPIGGKRCTGFRVQGTYGNYQIDDAAAAPFDVVAADGEVARVLPEHIALVLSVTEVSVPSSDVTPITRFLAERGVQSTVTPAVSLEACLRDGDEVVIHGPVELMSRARGYRDVSFTRIFSGSPERPVVVRDS